jgi:hypothetical protein
MSIFQWLAAKVALTQLNRMQGAKVARGSLVQPISEMDVQKFAEAQG